MYCVDKLRAGYIRKNPQSVFFPVTLDLELRTCVTIEPAFGLKLEVIVRFYWELLHEELKVSRGPFMS